MPKATGQSMLFSEMVYASVTESAANTLTFQKLETGYGTLDKTAWVIHRIEWYISAAVMNLMAATDDVISMALTTSNQITGLDLSSAALVDLMELNPVTFTAVGFHMAQKPWIRDFTNLPGGGKLALPNPLYLATKGTSLASAVTAKARITFSGIAMSDQDWLQLVEQTRLLT